MLNWEFYDFDTDNDLWFDANGAFMVSKRLNERKGFAYTPDNNVASNFYPV